MHIEEAIEQCVEGNVFIAVRSYMEKQALLDLLQDRGYSIGWATPETYRVFPYCALNGYQDIDGPIRFTFRESNTRDDRPKIEFHDLLLEDTPIALDVNSISGLL